MDEGPDFTADDACDNGPGGNQVPVEGADEISRPEEHMAEDNGGEEPENKDDDP
jgi:hypothetical protein